ncbi:MAG: hypothetical protein LQ342_001864 [Letrouitia transgressa]|nr:MAG: hypothetical protein LQ342_001864 [Letrouitia transgressa]
MGRQPAVIIIARHGARLDAADKQWHFTSPTPYDPPLTYGGWIQSRTLGNRIGSILHTRESGLEEQPANGSLRKTTVPTVDEYGSEGSAQSTKKNHKTLRKHKIYVHTSPFLRCMQTSVAITAGISQFNRSLQAGNHHLSSKNHHMHSEVQHPTHPIPSFGRNTDHWSTPHLSAIPEPEGQISVTQELAKPILRIDPFLGEWLSPEYFEQITPPPSSVMMLAGAKAELMRGGDYVDLPPGSNRNKSSIGNFPGGWSTDVHSMGTDKATEDGPLSTVSSIGQSLPRLNRASSHSNVTDSTSVSNNRSSPKTVSKIEAADNGHETGYDPPTPSYAISPSDPIPPGYVTHARDACVDVDFKWDSMRSPYDWGDGGDYGEEWSAMHRRFRRGLQNMILAYQYHGTSNIDRICSQEETQSFNDEEDADTDTVLILVTHGSGCNALIGALTNQPVLLDVGMASLTMAVRKDSGHGSANTAGLLNRSRRRSSIGSTVADEYEMKITASTEHLRTGPRLSPTILPHRSPSLSSSPIISHHRYRTHSTASSTSSTDGEFKLDPDIRSATGIGTSGGLSKSVGSSAGLWSRPVAVAADGSNEQLQPHKERAPHLSGNSPLTREVSVDEATEKNQDGLKPSSDTEDLVNGATGHPTTQHGLWGAPPSTMANEREKGMKRRWTHHR